MGKRDKDREPMRIMTNNSQRQYNPKTAKDVVTRIPLHHKFQGDLFKCPACDLFLWCIGFDLWSQSAEMRCWKCNQMWYDVPMNHIDKWFQMKMWVDYKLKDVTIFDFMYRMRPQLKRRIRILYGQK